MRALRCYWNVDFVMKIALLTSLLAAGILSMAPAWAGAAMGTPSSFFPPYPDYGCDARCIVRHEAAFHCRLVEGGRLSRRNATWCRSAD